MVNGIAFADRQPSQPGLGSQLDAYGPIKTVNDGATMSVNRDQTQAILETSDSATLLAWNPMERTLTVNYGKTLKELQPFDVTTFNAKGCPIKSFHPLDGTTSVRKCDAAQYVTREERDGGSLITWNWSNNHKNLVRISTQGNYTVAKSIEDYNEKGDLVSQKDYENRAATDKMYLSTEVANQYRYDNRGNWIWRKSTIKSYEDNGKTKSSQVVLTRTITYWK